MSYINLHTRSLRIVVLKFHTDCSNRGVISLNRQRMRQTMKVYVCDA